MRYNLIIVFHIINMLRLYNIIFLTVETNAKIIQVGPIEIE